MWIVWFSLYVTVAALMVYIITTAELREKEEDETFATWWIDNEDVARTVMIGALWPVAGPIWLAWFMATRQAAKRDSKRREEKLAVGFSAYATARKIVDEKLDEIRRKIEEQQS